MVATNAPVQTFSFLGAPIEPCRRAGTRVRDRHTPARPVRPAAGLLAGRRETSDGVGHECNQGVFA
jgi:hypothetical protein